MTGVKLFDANLREEDVKDVRTGDVIVYPNEDGCNNYLIVNEINTDIGKIYGQIASTTSVNKVSVKDIVTACDL